jgi:hypothetical protein
MLAVPMSVESFSPGQRVRTSFGPGTVSAIGRIDSVIYVTLSNESTGLYILRPEQVEAIEAEN